VLVDQQRIRQVLRYNSLLLLGSDTDRWLAELVDLVQIIDDVDALTLRALAGLNNPIVIKLTGRLRLLLLVFDLCFNLVESLLEVLEVLWQREGLWHEVKFIEAELGPHLADVLRELVFPSQLHGVQEVVDLLILAHPFINLNLVLEADARPEQVPLVLVCLLDTVGRQYVLQDLALRVNKLEESRVRILDDRQVRFEDILAAAHHLEH